MEVNVIGAGLAGAECALQLAKRGIKVNLYEMRPEKMTGAHTSEKFAEFVCSNSLGSYDVTNASGLLKKEMEMLGGELIKVAYECQVPAGGALAIDRELFSARVTELIEKNENIKIIREEITQIPEDPTVIASGPLTSDALADSIKEFTQSEHLHFFDAIAPIVEKDSINFDVAFYANRYDKEVKRERWKEGKLFEESRADDFGQKQFCEEKLQPSLPPSFLPSLNEQSTAHYINCPMNKEQYEKFYNILINAPKIELKEFEKDAKFFESCLPIEVIAARGVDTLRFGPMKPVGLVDKRKIGNVHADLHSRPDLKSESRVGSLTHHHQASDDLNANRHGEENYAVVQLRQDNSAKTLYNLVGFQTNLKWAAQKELLQSIPGLESVNIIRYGVMHRNTFINSPKVLNASLQSRKRPDLFFAGQITGTEGYTESIATGMLAGINMARYLARNTPHPIFQTLVPRVEKSPLPQGAREQDALLELPKTTILGALTQYISDRAHEKFQPINSNWGIVEPIELPKKERKNKKLKNELLAKRSIESLEKVIIL